jgi:hypothetical protein
MPDCPYVFAHATGRLAGEPVKDVKNGFHAALEIAELKDFTWHDLRWPNSSAIAVCAWSCDMPILAGVPVGGSGAIGRASPNTAAGRSADREQGKKRATCREARSAAGESRRISEGNWLAALDDFRPG